MNIDPALRNAGGDQSAHCQPHGSPPPYSNVSGQTPRLDSLQSASSNTAPSYSHHQQHQYYGMPTPTSYPPSGAATSHEQGLDDSPGANNPSDPNDLKRSRACEACRQLKVRCEPDDNNPTGSCKRCAKAGRQCVITAPTRKRQKKTDNRVAELEKKIDALTASLVARGTRDAEGNLDPAIAQAQMAELQQSRDQLYDSRPWQESAMGSPATYQSTKVARDGAGTKRKIGGDYDFTSPDLSRARNESFARSVSGNQVKPGVTADGAIMPPVPVMQALFTDPDARNKSSNGAAYIDVIDRHVIDERTAYRIFDRYHKEMCKYTPFVVFPPATKAEDIRRSKPILFLAIMAAASAAFRPELQHAFFSELTRILADKVMYRGAKSLELVQALQLLTIYYQPPERYEELNFNQLIHIAAVMCLDLGMGKRSKTGAFVMFREYMDRKTLPDPNSAETRRCWLGCYWMCANAGMSLRRPLLLRWSAYNDECLQLLSTAPDALPSDKWLSDLVRLQHIAEEISFQFSMDDPASAISLADKKTQYHLTAFEHQLQDWQAHATTDMPKAIIQYNEQITNLYMHEIAMHHNHNIDDFKPPYNITPEVATDEVDPMTPAHIAALTVCLEAIHGAFEAFLSLDPEILRAFPTIFFVRNSYAAVALIKMYSAVSAKDSKFGSIIDVADLKVEEYLDRLIACLTKAAENDLSRAAHKFGFILNMLKSWHLKRIEAAGGGQSKTPNLKHIGAAYPVGDGGEPSAQAWEGRSDDFIKSTTSGLHMLSDAAMQKNSSSVLNPAMGISASMPANGNEAFASAHLGNMPTGTTPLASAGGNANLDYGFLTPNLSDLQFTPNDFNAMGNLMDDVSWMNFPMEQGGGWAF